jgi:hypothetical protein
MRRLLGMLRGLDADAGRGTPGRPGEPAADDAVLLDATADLGPVAAAVVRERARLARRTVPRSMPHRLEVRLPARSRGRPGASAGPDAEPAAPGSER